MTARPGDPDARPDHGRGWRALGLVAVAALVGAAAVWGWQRLHWPVDVVRIDGEVVHSDRARMKQVVARHTQAGFFAMELGALRAELRAMPWVRDVALRRVWPGELHVSVTEHLPAARWNDGALISREGAVFRPGRIGHDDLPRLQGPEGHAAQMLERLRAFGERLGPLGLGVVAVEQDARRSWRLELDNGMTLRLGRDSLTDRMERFAVLWPGLLARKAERIAAVDLRYTNGLAVAWESGETDPTAAEGAPECRRNPTSA